MGDPTASYLKNSNNLVHAIVGGISIAAETEGFSRCFKFGGGRSNFPI